MSDLPVTVTNATENFRGLVLGLSIHDDTVVAAGGQGTDLLLVAEDGVTFRRASSGGRGLRGAFLRGDGLWVCGEYGYLARSNDLGQSWTKIPTKTQACLFGIVEDASSKLWVAGDAGYLASSTTGDTFTKVKGVDEFIARIWNSPLGVLVPTDDPGHLYIVQGKSITKTAAEAKADLMTAVVTPAGTLIAVGAQGVVLRSEDRGESFTKVDVSSRALLCGAECFEDGRVVIVGDAGLILLSKDDGKTFEKVSQFVTAKTLWCCRRWHDVVLAGGEDGLVLTIGERGYVATPKQTSVEASAKEEVQPANPAWAAPAPSTAQQIWQPPAPLPVERRDGMFVSPQLRALLHPRRGGIATTVRPLPTIDEAWAAVRRLLWAADRDRMSRKQERSSIWGFVTSSASADRALGERLLDPSPRVGTADEDVKLLDLVLEKYNSFIGQYGEETSDAMTDFLVASVGLEEAIRRCFAGLEDELPYVGVGPFARLRELLARTTDAEYASARAVGLEALEREIAKDPSKDRHIADLLWAATFLFPLGPSAGDEERKVHDRALKNTVKFGDFGVHACGLAAGDLASLQLYLAKNGKVRHEFFAHSSGRMYLASILELAGKSAAPVLAKMKPDDPWEKDPGQNGFWCQLIAHVDDDAALEALHRERREPSFVWGTAGLVTAARLDPERVLSFARKKGDDDLVEVLEEAIAQPIAGVAFRVPGSSVAESLARPLAYEPIAPQRLTVLTSRASLEPESTFRDEERERAKERGIYEEAVTWDGAPIGKLGGAELEAFIAHREKWAIPTGLSDLALAPQKIHARLFALGFHFGHAWTGRAVPSILHRGGLGYLPLLYAVFDTPELLETALAAAQPFGDVALVPAMTKAFAGKKNKAPARSWILRHPRHAAAGAVALWSEGGDAAADALRVLRFLDSRDHRRTILEQAAAYDPAAIARALDQDPLAAPKVKKPVLPAFAKASALPELVTSDGGEKASPDDVERLLLQLAFSNADEVHPGVIAAKARFTSSTRAAFVWALFEAWLAEGADAKHGWCMQSLGFLGDDECARKLTALAKGWPGQNASARAQAALDALLNLGTDAALLNINLLAEKSKFPAFKAAAKERIDAIADARGLTSDELADRIVPTLGLEDEGARRLDFGARSFEIVFAEDLLPRLRADDGKILDDLPKPNKSDDKDLAKAAKAAYAALKKDARTSASLQITRMERAMRSQRRIDATVFDACFAKHPWMSHLARRFVWATVDDAGELQKTFRVAEDGSLADAADDAFELGKGHAVVLVHPIALPEGEVERWGQVFGDYGILQPFPQLARPIFTVAEEERAADTLTRHRGRVASYTALRGLETRGWERSYDASVQMARRLGTRGWVSLETEPGWHPSQTAEDIDPQTIEGLRIWGDGDSNFGSLSPLEFSELLYDLELIIAP